MGNFPMSVANNLCDELLPKYLDSKTVLIYRPHPVNTTIPTLSFWISWANLFIIL